MTGRYIVSLVIALSASLLLSSQTLNDRHKIDSLGKLISELKEDTNMVLALDELANAYGTYRSDTAITLSSRALALAQDLHWSKGIGFSNEMLGLFHYYQGDFTNALDYLNKAKSLWESLIQTNKNSKYFNYHKAKSMTYKGLIYFEQGNYTATLENYLPALKTAESNNNIVLKKLLYGNLAIVYTEKNEYQTALNLYFKRLELDEKSHDKLSASINLGNIGVTYKRMGNNTEAMKYYLQALHIDREIDDKSNAAMHLASIAVLYQEVALKKEKGIEKDTLLNKAFEYFTEAIRMDSILGYKRYLGIDYYNMGGYYFAIHNIPAATKFFEKSLMLSRETGDLEGLVSAYTSLAHIDSLNGNFKSALQNYKNLVLYRDSISNEVNTKKQTQLEMQFEFDKKTAADSVRVAEEKKVAAAELKTEKNKSYTLYGGLALVLIFAGFMYNRFRVTQKQKKIIEEQKQIVEHQKQIVEERNKEVMDSIYYARRIQRSLLPTEKYIQKVLKN